MGAEEIVRFSRLLSEAGELLYPGPFGEITAGGDKNYPIDYSHLNIHGYALGG